MDILILLTIPAEELARYEAEGFDASDQIIHDINALLYEEGNGSSCTMLAGGFTVLSKN